MTVFCSTSLTVAPDLALTIDGNGKVTTSGGFESPRPNALSLPAVASCPGSTAECRRSCYAAHIPPEIRASCADNLRTILALLLSPGLAADAARRLGAWIAEHAPYGFRWHVSGDVTSVEHARWIVAVCAASPSVRHWIYTRTLGAVPTLAEARNLRVLVSADAGNYAAARAVAERHHLRLAYLCQDGRVPRGMRPRDILFPDYLLRGRSLPVATDAPWWAMLTEGERGMVCPADFEGQSETRRCATCRGCL